MKIKVVLDYLEELAPSQYQESYDNAGLIVGNEDQELTGYITCLDSTEAVIDEAIAKNCNLVIAHHPIVFSGLKSIRGDDYVTRTIIKAIKNDIAIFAIHTNLDNMLENGVNSKICDQLGLKNRLALVPKITEDEERKVGTGMIGELSKSMTTKDFLEFLKNKMEVNCIRHTELVRKEISKVAVCGGSGSFLLSDAISSDADIFITGDFKYHEFFDADGDIIIADIGHYESEKFTNELLYDLIKNKFSTFAGYCTAVNTNPVKYFM